MSCGRRGAGVPKVQPTCCVGWWVIICIGSRFCTAAEAKYHPIKGELLGVTWALEKTGYYTLGSEKLLILVDHKPLLGLLGNRELGEISNPRLKALTERTMRWSFEIQHIAVAKNFDPIHCPGTQAGLESWVPWVLEMSLRLGGGQCKFEGCQSCLLGRGVV